MAVSICPLESCSSSDFARATAHLAAALASGSPEAVAHCRVARSRLLLDAGKDVALCDALAAMCEALASASEPASVVASALLSENRVTDRLRQVLARMDVGGLPFMSLRVPGAAPCPQPAAVSAMCHVSRSDRSSWPSPRHVSWLAGAGCAEIDCGHSRLCPKEMLALVQQGAPAVLRNFRCFPAACDQWSFEYLARHLHAKNMNVFAASGGDFSYWYGKPNTAGFNFQPPSSRHGLTFQEFLARRGSPDAGSNGTQRGEEEILYLQETLYVAKGRKDPLRREVMSTQLVRDWETSLSWETLEQVRQAGSLGPLTNSVLFCSGRDAYSRPHYDQNANLYLQLRGAKRWLLFCPQHGHLLYPYPKGHPLDRKARVDFQAPQLDAFPQAAQLRGRGIEITLEPGDVLWLPSHWWHAVQSLEPETLSLNFWWNPPAEPRFMPEDQAAIELSRDMESLIQRTLGPPFVERFLREWRGAVLPQTPAEVDLRVLFFATIAGMLRSTRLQSPASLDLFFGLLDAGRYSGLSFADVGFCARACARSIAQRREGPWCIAERRTWNTAWHRRRSVR